MRKFTILMVLVPLLLVACNSDDGDEESLPTRVSLVEPTATAEATTATVEETAVVTVVTDEATTEAITEAPESTPEAAEATSDATPTPTSPPARGPGSIVEDFSTLQAGQVVTISGVIEVQEINDLTVVTMRDANGNQVEVRFPLSIAETISGQPYTIRGSVQDTGSVGLMVLDPGEVAEETAQVPPFAAQATAENIDPLAPVAESTTLDTTLDAGLTALQAYDNLLPLIEDELENRFLSAISGNPDAGWRVEFIAEGDNQALIYTVMPDGQVVRSTGSPTIIAPDVPVSPLDRDAVTLDSDVVYGSVDLSDLPGFVKPNITLIARGDDTIEWQVGLNPPVTLDATTG
jgi:hypothetical protein